MRGQELLDKLEHIAPQYIEEAGTSSRVRRTAGTRVLVAAVCACVVAAAVIVPQYLPPTPPHHRSAPRQIRSLTIWFPTR